MIHPVRRCISHYSRFLLLVCLLLGLSVHGSCSDQIVLFDGSTLDGWAHTGPGYFAIDKDQKSLVAMGGMGMLWYYDRQFGDFELELEWRRNIDNANSGVFIRFPNIPQKVRPNDAEGRGLAGPWGAVNEGYEIQIYDAATDGLGTGSLYSFFNATRNPSKPTGEWNQMKIRAVGQHYQVWINGEKVGDYTGNRALKGYVGVQNHGHDKEVEFRNIRIRELDSK
ncbi:MAG: DUF1080 domain-containing protein [Candidatus Omnitrophica bacterium]|nr:hypothetical protein [bacterium]NUN97051.1 DUF1080 domain-containing protein [Candidatus Omnitrophota bacterium]